MKTGRLLKFRRSRADIHAYVYRDGAGFKASVYVAEAGVRQRQDPVMSIDGETEARVEDDVRAWVEKNYPKG
jgi:hypothetical protein